MFERLLLLWLVLISAVAYFWSSLVPEGFDPFAASQPAFPWLIAATMFAVGVMLPRDELRQVRERWPSVLFGTAVQYTAMPLAAWAAAHLFSLSLDYQIGIILVGCVPGAMASNVVTMNARGHTSYSVSLTTCSTMLSPLIVPFVLKFALGETVTVNPWQVSLNLVLQVVAPVLLGVASVRLFPRWEPVGLRWGPVVANLTILWIIASVVATNRERLASGSATVVVPLLLLNLLGYLAGWGGGKMYGLPDSMRRALAIEVGMQNAGLGTSLAIQLFKDRPAATVPTALYTFGCVLTAMLLAQWWALHPPQDASASSGEAPSGRGQNTAQ